MDKEYPISTACLGPSERKCLNIVKCKCLWDAQSSNFRIYITCQCTETTTGVQWKIDILKTFKSKFMFKKIHSSNKTVFFPFFTDCNYHNLYYKVDNYQQTKGRIIIHLDKETKWFYQKNKLKNGDAQSISLRLKKNLFYNLVWILYI